MNSKVPTCLGGNQTTIHGCTDLNFTKLGHQVSCSHKCFWFGSWGYVGIEPYWKMQPTNCLCIIVIQQQWTELYHDWKGGIRNGVCSP